MTDHLDDATRNVRALVTFLRDALAGEVDIFTAAETAKRLGTEALVSLTVEQAQRA